MSDETQYPPPNEEAKDIHQDKGEGEQEGSVTGGAGDQQPDADGRPLPVDKVDDKESGTG